MPLQSQLLPLPLNSGLDEKADPRWLDLGAQTSVVNLVFYKAGVLGKRWGYTALGKGILGGGSISACAHLGSLGTQLTLNDGHRYYSYSSVADGWVDLDQVSECEAWHEPLAEGSTSATTWDVAFGSGYLISVWTSLNGALTVYASIRDYTTGTYVVPATVVAGDGTTSYACARVIVQGSKAIFVYKDNTNQTDLYARAYDLSARTWGAAVKIVNDFDTSAGVQVWDICPVVGSTTDWILVYPRYSGASRFAQLTRFDTALAQQATHAMDIPSGSYHYPAVGFAVVANAGEQVWTAMVYMDATVSHTTVSCAAHDVTTLANTLGETPVLYIPTSTGLRRVGVCRVSATQACVTFQNSKNSGSVLWGQVNTSGTVSGTARELLNHTLVGKPFVQGGRTYCTIASLQVRYAIDPNGNTTTAPQGYYALLDLNTSDTSATQQCGRIVAYLAPRIANTTGSSNSVCVNAAQASTTRWISAGSVAGATSTRSVLRSLTYDFATPWRQHAELGEVTYLSGGVLSMFDGVRVTEMGFFSPPPSPMTLVGAASGGNMSDGVYNYLALYQWVDSTGQVHRSASQLNSVTLSGGGSAQKVTVTLHNCSATNRQDVESNWAPPIQIQLYRTTAGGAVYYQLLSDTAALVNDPKTLTQTLVDTVDDATLTGYNFGVWPYSGNAVEPFAPPSSLGVVAHNNRLWSIGDDRQTLWYSTEANTQSQGQAPRFNDEFRVVIPEGGPIVGIASQDGALIVFKKDRLYQIQGNGSNETRTQNDLSAPTRIPSDVGCTERRSIVKSPLGIFFLSVSGIYLLSRGFEVVYVGSPVETTLSENPVIKAATLVARQNEIRWACAPSETSTTGVDIVYNYLYKNWAIFKRYDNDASLSSAASVSEISVDNTYYWAVPGGRVYRENSVSTAAGAYMDAGNWVYYELASANAKANGIAGWGRFWNAFLVSESLDPADLTLSVATDYSSTYSQSQTFSADEMSRWTTPLEMGRIQIAQQKATAVRIRITDGPPSGGPAAFTGQSSLLIGLQLEVGLYSRGYRHPVKQSV